MVKVRLLRPEEMDGDLLESWRGLQMSDPELERPFFSPEYVQVLGEFRTDIRVAVIERGGEAAGFFPFQLTSRSVARPAGLRLNDFQGLVASPGIDLDGLDLLRRAGLSVFHFDHLLVHQAPFRRFHVSRTDSPFIDLSRGYETYLRAKILAGAHWPCQIGRKMRRLAREVGEPRFEFDCRDDRVYEQLLNWKSLQRERTGTPDVLRLDWVRRFLDRLRGMAEPGLSGRLSALYAGPRLVAAHFGLACRRCLHAWFPAYDIDVEKYSPGLLLFVELFQAAARTGFTRVDLGKGRERFKLSLASASLPVAEGCAVAGRIRRFLSESERIGRRVLRTTGLAGVTRRPRRRLRKLLERLSVARTDDR